jgi:uncharacterized membrane protein
MRSRADVADGLRSAADSAVDAGGAEPGRRIELLPNCSLTPRQARLFFATVAVTSLSVAGFFVASGYWPVLPFAGLELALLGYALAASQRRRHYVQTVDIDETHITVTTRGPGGARENQFSRHWAEVKLHGPQGWQPSRLLIESHGRACEIGAFLTEEERRALSRRLMALVGRTGNAPPLAATRARDR